MDQDAGAMPNPGGTTWTIPYPWRGCLAFSPSLKPRERRVPSMRQRKRWEDSGTNGFSVDFHSLIFYTVERLALK